jgi:hypothetical protein
MNPHASSQPTPTAILEVTMKKKVVSSGFSLLQPHQKTLDIFDVPKK